MASASSEPDKKTVGTPTDLYLQLNERWAMIKALMGGTLAMRAAGTTYLPQEKKETSGDYDKRVARSFLFNGYRDSVEKIVAKPFARNVSLKNADDLPEQLQDIEGDADHAGTTLTDLSRELMQTGMDHGLVHMWVDYPRLAEQPNLAEQREQGIRPTFIPIRPSDLIGWQSAKDSTGQDVLTQARIREHTQVDDGDFGMTHSTRVRVLETDGYRLFEMGEDDKWAQIEEGTWTGFKGVPIVTAYLTRCGFMCGEPVLEDLAWLNVAHWQSSSDQMNILRFARTGLIFVKGITPDELKEQGGIVLGPNGSLVIANPSADAKVVEHSGAAIKAGADSIAALEQKMQVLGLQPFFRMSGGATATEKMIDEGRYETEVQSWIKTVESLVLRGYELAARWAGVELPEDFGVDIYSEFIMASLVDRDLKSLIQMRIVGDIDRETLLGEVRRRGIFGADVTVEQIMARIGAEGPDLSGIGGSTDE